MKQMFRIGDRVRVRETLIFGTVTEVTRSKHRYAYRLKSERIHPRHWVHEDILKSATQCPTCKNTGWDWITGCGYCSLTPADFE
ncbi:MAG TPA: hypothetical protein V6D12_13650 [Candidatus Obscuribacterales bacterium]